MKIRKAQLKDAEAMAELSKQFWDAHKNIDPLIKPLKKQTIKGHIIDAKKTIKDKNNYIFVAEKDSKIIGAITFFIKINDKYFKEKKYGYLDSATTHKDYRKQGVARELNDFALRYLKNKGIKYVRANVYNSNKIALKAWKKIGFKEQSTNLLKKI